MKIESPVYSYLHEQIFNKKSINKPENSLIKTIDDFFNLGNEKRDMFSITPHDSQSLKLISNLLKKGIVGYEYLDIKNKPYKSFVTTRIGSDNLSDAKLYKKKNFASRCLYI